MRRDPRVWLTDILQACDLITEFTRLKTFNDYVSDALLRSAVERQLGIVGEAVRSAVRDDPSLATRITGTAAIIAFRNVLTHAYGAVDHATVWGIVERRVPLLRNEVERLLAEFRTPS
jgi:uncharacterized protein with HEPN domain